MRRTKGGGDDTAVEQRGKTQTAVASEGEDAGDTEMEMDVQEGGMETIMETENEGGNRQGMKRRRR